MEILIQLRLDDIGRIKKQILIGGPSSPAKPRHKPGEINFLLSGDDAFINSALHFAIEHFKEGTVIGGKFTGDTNTTK